MQRLCPWIFQALHDSPTSEDLLGVTSALNLPGLMNSHFWRPILASSPHLKRLQLHHGAVQGDARGEPHGDPASPLRPTGRYFEGTSAKSMALAPYRAPPASSHRSYGIRGFFSAAKCYAFPASPDSSLPLSGGSPRCVQVGV
jgi:hypothetical protein